MNYWSPICLIRSLYFFIHFQKWSIIFICTIPGRKLKPRHLNSAPRLPGQWWQLHILAGQTSASELPSTWSSTASPLCHYVLLGSCLIFSHGNIHFLDESVFIKHLGSTTAVFLIMLTWYLFISLQVMKGFHIHHTTDWGRELHGVAPLIISIIQMRKQKAPRGFETSGGHASNEWQSSVSLINQTWL